MLLDTRVGLIERMNARVIGQMNGSRSDVRVRHGSRYHNVADRQASHLRLVDGLDFARRFGAEASGHLAHAYALLVLVVVGALMLDVD